MQTTKLKTRHAHTSSAESTHTVCMPCSYKTVIPMSDVCPHLRQQIHTLCIPCSCQTLSPRSDVSTLRHQIRTLLMPCSYKALSPRSDVPTLPASVLAIWPLILVPPPWRAVMDPRGRQCSRLGRGALRSALHVAVVSHRRPPGHLAPCCSGAPLLPCCC